MDCADCNTSSWRLMRRANNNNMHYTYLTQLTIKALFLFHLAEHTIKSTSPHIPQKPTQLPSHCLLPFLLPLLFHMPRFTTTPSLVYHDNICPSQHPRTLSFDLTSCKQHTSTILSKFHKLLPFHSDYMYSTSQPAPQSDRQASCHIASYACTLQDAGLYLPLYGRQVLLTRTFNLVGTHKN